MKIINSTPTEYAHIELDRSDQRQIGELQKNFVDSVRGSTSLKGIRIEVSEHDCVSEEVRRSLVEGRFFVVR